ncbi:hypothetical protein ACJ41O_000675 [Fusarium nematophilum]
MSTQRNPLPQQAQGQDGPSAEEVRAMLQTPWDDVYAISQDGTTYTSPSCLRGTPVAKITEGGPYWNPRWNSLDQFLAQEEAEEKLKRESQARLQIDPTDKAAAAAHKLHTDNVSKHRRIRDIFGPGTTYHPNQLVSKMHLPDEGLCQKEIMYRLACKVSDLRVLKDRRELAMDPWDFIRWRISRKIRAFVTAPWQSAQYNIRTIVYKICEDAGTGHPAQQKYEDRLLRNAILQSARYQGRLGSFNLKNNKQKVIGGGPPTRPRTSSGQRNRSGTLSTAVSRPLPLPAGGVGSKEKREKVSRPSEYQGVNAFRARQKLREVKEEDNV